MTQEEAEKHVREFNEERRRIANISDLLLWAQSIRVYWKLETREELWFRGEEKRFGGDKKQACCGETWPQGNEHPLRTFLMPKIYRDLKHNPVLPDDIAQLLKDEDFLYQEFQRLGSKFVHATYPDADWEWDSYFLMQAHGAPTRLLDFTDGALIALHFAVRQTVGVAEEDDGVVYVLNSYHINNLMDDERDVSTVKENWKEYAKKRASKAGSDAPEEDDWDRSYLPRPFGAEDIVGEEPPRPPERALALYFPHFTSRIGAQRSRLLVFGRDPWWLQNTLVSCIVIGITYGQEGFPCAVDLF
ncbi:FRG domain-containing protein [Verrucomicrobium sp. 3C]|uniref:FRG domain-containing protein n=1 Tax=Verrucomicrobium sp. 3C TaxID=1134055 RepID=UPI00036B9416|nr:FRG domain-containing protein [Verrucomicrobium sp. 3C]